MSASQRICFCVLEHASYICYRKLRVFMISVSADVDGYVISLRAYFVNICFQRNIFAVLLEALILKQETSNPHG